MGLKKATLKKAVEEPMIVKNNGGTRGVALTNQQLRAAAYDMVRRHAVQLGEHFSSVTIICTRVDPDGQTYRYTEGAGDLFARMKATGLWLQEVHERQGE